MKYIITEEQKNLISGEENKELPRMNYAGELTKWKIQAFHDKGLKLYYFNPTDGKDFGLVEFKEPIDRQPWNREKSSIYVFSLTQHEVSKINQMISNIKELIGQYHKIIGQYKLMVPAVMKELVTGKKDK